jgi:hypothetical protein
MVDSSVIDMLQNGQEDMIWFNQNSEILVKKFNNSFIAFQNKQVLDSDRDLSALLKKLKSEKIDVSTVFIEFISDIKSIL